MSSERLQAGAMDITTRPTMNISSDTPALLSPMAERELRTLLLDQAEGYRLLKGIGSIRRKVQDELNVLHRSEGETEIAAKRVAHLPPDNLSRKHAENVLIELRQRMARHRATLARVDAEEREITAWHGAVSRLAEALLQRLNTRAETLFPELETLR